LELVGLVEEVKTSQRGVREESRRRGLPGYSKQLVNMSNPSLPQPLTSIFDESYKSLAYNKLLAKSEEVINSMKLTEAEVKAVFEETKEQSESETWFSYRAGRVTASLMGDVCHSKDEMPPLQLIQKVCYKSNNFRSVATDWGLEHEEDAREVYKLAMKDHHNLEVRESGLVLNPKFTFLGVSPDGIVECTCCGTGCLEIKCPWKFKDYSIEEMVDEKGSYLQRDDDDEITLSKKHSYYYQVQAQMLITGYNFCDFFVKLNDDAICIRIEKDQKVLDEILEKSSNFVLKGVLPELLAKFYTEPVILIKDSISAGSESSKCYCKLNKDEDAVIECANKNCTILSYHVKCVKMKKIPSGKWYCPECRRHGMTTKRKRVYDEISANILPKTSPVK